jgi:hypothetical protein
MVAVYAESHEERLHGILTNQTHVFSRRDGCWHVKYRGRKLIVAADALHDRMRAMTPIVEAIELRKTDLWLVLGANFDRALDARYAVAGGYLWSLFLHPLSELTDRMLIDGLDQTVWLADSYGDSYASSSLRFYGGA